MTGKSPLVLPGGLEVDMSEPSPDTQLLASGIQQLIFLLGGNTQTGEPGVLQMLQGVQMQLDTLIRMEAHETPRAEIKRRIEKADYASDKQMRERQEAQQQALAEMEKNAERTAELAEELKEPVGVTEPPADPHEDEHDIGGEG